MRSSLYKLLFAMLAVSTTSCAYLQSGLNNGNHESVMPDAIDQASTLARDDTIEVTGRSSAPALALEDQILVLVNQQRDRAGMKPLSLSPELAKAAREHSAAMAAQGFFEHRGDGEPELFDRVTASGLDTDHVGENIFESNESRGSVADDCVQMWLESPGHRRNMLSRDFERTGIAVGKSIDGESYITEDFAH